jgi:shikimate dehydrogenase
MIDSVVGIIGWPISHSISPIMQNRAFLEAGLSSWAYVAMPVSKYPYIRIKEAVLGLRALGFKGANVTVPYKEAVVPYLERLSDEARAIGAVNTIVIDSEGRLVGHNTDGAGFIKDLAEHGITINNKRALILGAGGSARAIGYALLAHGCTSMTILNRTKSKADDIANSFGDLFKDAMIDTGPLIKDSLVHANYADIVINTTSIGLASTQNQMPWDENVHFSPDQIVYDVIYNPKNTALLMHAQKDGAKTLNGLGMLVHQGALAFEIWTGHKAPVDVMKKAASEAVK